MTIQTKNLLFKNDTLYDGYRLGEQSGLPF